MIETKDKEEKLPTIKNTPNTAPCKLIYSLGDFT